MVDVNWNYSFEEYALWCSIENSFQFGFIFGERMEIYPNTQVLIKHLHKLMFLNNHDDQE